MNRYILPVVGLHLMAAAAVGGAQDAVHVTARSIRETASAMPSLEARVRTVSRAMSGMGGLASLRELERLGAEGEYRALMRSVDDTPRAIVTGDQTTDSLYRMGRQALDRRDYRRAADLFMQVRARDRKAPIAADALYWHAWAMSRQGNTAGLETALASLTTLADEYPRASVAGDARTLRVRVCGELARQGDERCAREITERADGGTGRSEPRTARGGARPSSRGSGSQEQGCPDEDDDERIEALNALLQMDSDRALPILERTLSRRDRCSAALRRKAVFLVSQKREPRAADILMNSVRTDPDREVREQAVFWLGQTRDERAVTMLEDILKTEKDEDVLDKAVFALSQHNSERAGTMLRDIAQRDGAPKHLREQAIFWIGQRKSAENATLLIGLFEKVNDEDLKDKIIFSLSQTRSTAVDKWLMDLVVNEREDVDVRKKALFWAGQNKSASLETLGSLYGRLTNNEMKDQLIFVLSQRRDGVEKLIDIARTEKDRELRKKAIFWLGQIKDPKAVKFMEELINR
jgi:HEAT repeat protein